MVAKVLWFACSQFAFEFEFECVGMFPGRGKRPSIIVICMTINKMHVCQLVKGVSIHTALFTTAQYKNVRILCHIL
jgi:hypothetical protein